MTDLKTRAAALLAAADKMTPGEWLTRGTETLDVVYTDDHHKMFIQCHSYHVGYGVQPAERQANAAGIVALRNEAPALIRELLAENERQGDVIVDLLAKCIASAAATQAEHDQLMSGYAGPTPFQGRTTRRD